MPVEDSLLSVDVSRNCIARLFNLDGKADFSWDPNLDGNASDIVIVGDDIYVGGDFTSVSGLNRNHIAKLNNTTGQADPVWDANANGQR